ncbi:hypothetical protein BCF11_3351 [Collimonas sp. PA-H2]|uniref:hypothetical protein n=1 Tax=Collimonas sp. PA-H2 TaxID=1881062 RepID=UPI000BF9F7D0|nr:hypothetical protein [Collimonas sp. PA-H2]PFH10916.1 hypothetical protein BCF11_3351 [Collimonas sp. PA-H2]
MNKLLIAALLFSGLANAADKRTEVAFNNFIVEGASEASDTTFVVTRNPPMAMLVDGTGRKTLDRISSGKLMCFQVNSEKRREYQEYAMRSNAAVTQMEQAIALGFKMPEKMSKDYYELRLALKFVNDAGDAAYYDCK